MRARTPLAAGYNVGHDRAIVVINLDTDAIVGRVVVVSDMHGATVATEFGRGFISEEQPGMLVIFDLKTLAKVAEVPVGKDLISSCSTTRRAACSRRDRGDQQMTAIDAKTGRVAGTDSDLSVDAQSMAPRTRRDMCS